MLIRLLKRMVYALMMFGGKCFNTIAGILSSPDETLFGSLSNNFLNSHMPVKWFLFPGSEFSFGFKAEFKSENRVIGWFS